MTVQVTTQNDTRDLILSGQGISPDQETILTDAGRTTPLEFGTVMSKVAASQKWVPLSDVAAVDGSALPQGIYVGSQIAAADIVAGDVLDAPIISGGDAVVVDENLIVFDDEGTPETIDTIIGAGVEQRTVRDELARRGIFVGESVSITEQQS